MFITPEHCTVLPAHGTRARTTHDTYAARRRRGAGQTPDKGEMALPRRGANARVYRLSSRVVRVLCRPHTETEYSIHSVAESPGGVF